VRFGLPGDFVGAVGIIVGAYMSGGASDHGTAPYRVAPTCR